MHKEWLRAEHHTELVPCPMSRGSLQPPCICWDRLFPQAVCLGAPPPPQPGFLGQPSGEITL